MINTYRIVILSDQYRLSLLAATPSARWRVTQSLLLHDTLNVFELPPLPCCMYLWAYVHLLRILIFLGKGNQTMLTNCLFLHSVEYSLQVCRERVKQECMPWKYKVFQIWPGQTVTCLHTNRPGHIWTTLYIYCTLASPFTWYEVYRVNSKSN